MTSNSRESGSRTGSQTQSSPPMPCRRTSGSPSPERRKLRLVEGRSAMRAGYPPRLGRNAREPLVHEADDRGALADGGCAALDRARAGVARGVDPGHARLQEALSARVVSGEHEPLLVTGDRVTEPVGAGVGAEEEEQRRERELGPVL